MIGKEYTEKTLWQGPLRAALIWLAGALGLLLLSSLLIASSGASSRALGYASSAIHFIAALLTAAALVREGKGRGPVLGLLTGGGLCLLLLLLGCLIDARGLSADAVLSLVSFTLAGALLGSLTGGAPGGRRKRHSFSHSGGRKRR